MLLKHKDVDGKSVDTQLCQKGLDTECCAFCTVIRVSVMIRI